MTLSNIDRAKDLLKLNKNNKKLFFSNPASEDKIKSAEETLGIIFPKSYAIYLREFGCIDVGPYELYGIFSKEKYIDSEPPSIAIPDVVWTTLEYHKEFNHPLYLPIIYDVGEGTTYCLDTSQMNGEGECPVVAWPVGGYEETPVLEIVAPDFGTFFLDLVKRELHLDAPSDRN